MPRLPTMRVIGSQDISTSFRDLVGASCWGAVTVDMISLLVGQAGWHALKGREGNPRPFRACHPSDDTLAPGASSMKGMNLSRKRGMVQAMQMPPTFGP